MNQLDDEAREIILMRHAEQLTNSQAAELLGLTEPAASMRYLRDFAAGKIFSWHDTFSLVNVRYMSVEEQKSSPSEKAAGSARLAALVDELLTQARSGVPVDIDRVAADHPDLAGELRELWAVAVLAEEFGSQSDASIEGGGNAAEDGAPLITRLRTLPHTIDDYELFEELGRGGMGVVYRARQKSLDRIVALENRPRRLSCHPSRPRARFRGEAETAAQLNHPHIVPVYDVGQHNELPYFTMRFVRGTTLADRVAAGPLPSRTAAELLAPIAWAIAKAHQKGVLHRDLKPSNILIDTEGRPYVSDFGLAKRLVLDAPDGAMSTTAPSAHANRCDSRNARFYESRTGRRQPRHDRCQYRYI